MTRCNYCQKDSESAEQHPIEECRNRLDEQLKDVLLGAGRLALRAQRYAEREQRLIVALKAVILQDRSSPYLPEDPRPGDGLTIKQANIMGETFKTPKEIAQEFLRLLDQDPALRLPAW